MKIAPRSVTNSSQGADLSSWLCRGEFGRELTSTLDIATHQTVFNLGNIPQTLYYLGDGLQQAFADELFDLVNPETWRPASLLRWTSEIARESLQGARIAIPGKTSRSAWAELRNKTEIFFQVRTLSNILKLSPDQLLPLPELVARAYTLSPFLALWAVEGLGQYYTTTYWKLKGLPDKLLWEENAPVPEKSLLMLHAGLGLSIANRLLTTVSSASPTRKIRDVLLRIIQLCKNNSREGYLGAAIESLGLVTRDFYPAMGQVVHQVLSQIAPELTGFFWHGYGRALYFSFSYFLPVLRSAWGAVDNEVGGLPDELSAMAGLTWAVTLVNMRQPEIMEGVLQTYIQGSRLMDGFVNGVASAITMRQDTTPNEPFVSAFIHYRPKDQHLAELWTKCITQAGNRAINTYQPVLKRNKALDQVFRYQDLDQLAERLR